MGMSTHVKLLRDKDNPEYQRKLKVLIACREADVALPDEISEYFEGGDPEAPLEVDFIPTAWNNECASGVEVNLDDLPSGVKTIRFYNAW